MSIKYGFFNSVDGDRTYGCNDFNDWFKPLISNGIFMSRNSSALQVYASTGMQVSVRAGEGRFNGYWFESDAVENITIPNADVTMPRIDRIVVRVSNTDRNITLAVLKGEVGTSPIAPALTRNESVYEYSLAQVRVNANATAITQSNITDERLNADVCGSVTGLINQIDTTTLGIQFESALQEKIDAFDVNIEQVESDLSNLVANSESEFRTWFDSVKDEVQATTILRKYSSSYTTTAENESSIPINITQYSPTLDYLLVYVNGFKLIEGVEYTLTDATVELTTPLEVIGTVVSIDCYKSEA